MCDHQSRLTFGATSSYACEAPFNTNLSDVVVAKSVTIGVGATFSFNAVPDLPLGTVLTVINNTGSASISGSFSNLSDGSIFLARTTYFQANYEGGDGNDLTLTAVAP